ncbi:phospholipase [Hahella sp. KA22]|uniref:phospholipase n=1 Tax=Hahella sp. KA22 TaxID=1628392 RepID=UPI000FDF0EEB|nr:phospholipase [Hahella sp. KA22]AZZ95175.1 phospholipase [Hahella sp. KA22]QAY52820.1 phospholipase [Hahella sp. KA22]
MGNKNLILAGVILASLGVQPALAFKQETHKRFVIDAVEFMRTHPDITNYAKLEAVAAAAGISVTQMADMIGQGAYDVDDFEDTFLCGAVTGDCVLAPVWGLGSSIVNYTSYWHFQNHTRGADAHGNDIGGYDYSKLSVKGDVDNMAASWLKGDHLDDGAGGQTGWFGAEDSEYKSYQVTEANYRQGSYSTYSMYKDFENIPFQPIDNLGQYWYSAFWAQPTIQTLGFTLHTTDLLQPHHTWTTSALNHSGWEAWVRDYYDSENLNDDALVEQALADFPTLSANSAEIRPLLTKGGEISYSMGGVVLSSTDHSDRLAVAKIVVPHAIAMTVHILNHAMNRF